MIDAEATATEDDRSAIESGAAGLSGGETMIDAEVTATEDD